MTAIDQHVIATVLNAIQQLERNLTDRLVSMDLRISDEMKSLGRELDLVKNDVAALDKSHALLEARFMEILKINERISAIEESNKTTDGVKITISNLIKWLSALIVLLSGVGGILKIFGIF